MTWAARRRALYLGSVAAVALIFLGVFVFLFWYERPTCFDGVQNQGELGVDRGGPCELLHESQVKEATVLWSRAFQVVPGVYSAVAYVDNPNFSAGASNVPYSFKLFDSENILIAERRGVAYITPNSIVPVFEGGISTGNRVPNRTFFEFLEVPQWVRVDTPVEGLGVENWELSDEDKAPRITAVINNQSFTDIRDVDVVATIFDSADTAIGASRTVIDLLPKQSSQEVAFTWPRSFTGTVARIEITPQAPFHK